MRRAVLGPTVLVMAMVMALAGLAPGMVRAAGVRPVTLTLGVFAYIDAGLLRPRFEPLAAYLARQVPGLKIELRVLDAVEMDAAVAANQLDLVLSNPGHYMELRSRNALTGVLGTLVRQHAGMATASVGGVIVARDGSSIARLQDLRGRRVSATVVRGLGAWQSQLMELRRVGIDPLQDMQVVWLPSARQALEALLDGRVDVAFMRTGLLEDEQALQGLDTSRLKVLNPQRLAGYPFQLSTRLYPEWPLVALPHVEPALVRRIAAAVLALEADHPAARAAGIAGFDPPADYLPVEMLARELRVPPFDAAPVVRWSDLWEQHRASVLFTLAAALVIVGMSVLLVRRNRQLRRGNQELAASRSLLQTVIDTVPVQVVWKDRSGRTLGRNRSAAGERETADTGPGSLAPEEAEVVDKGQPLLAVESPWRRGDGSAGWQRRSTVPLRDADGRVTGVLGTHEDITWLRRQQDELAAARDRLQATIDAVPDLLFELGEDGTYLQVHAQRGSLLVATPGELLGRRIDEVLPPEAVAVCRVAMDRARAEGVSLGHQYRLDLPDGERWFELSGAVKRPAPGRSLSFVFVARDVTDRKRAADELQTHRTRLEELVERRTAELLAARDAAQAASQAKSLFLANMSHEIRTPLNAVIGMGHLLRRSPLNAQQRGWLEALSMSGEHLLEVINAILDLSKIEAGKLVLQPVRTDLLALVGNARSMMSQRAQDKGLQLVLELPERTPAVMADATRLRQALLNLMHNAIKFTERGSVRVVMRVRDEGADEVVVRLDVHDSGVGVAPEVMPRLFESFQQADNSPTRHWGGTGLGLAITRRLAHLMGGDAGGSSTPGVGSVFWFSARLRRCEGPDGGEPLASGAEQLEARLRAERNGRRVLLVEDDPINREVASALLGHVGQEVTCAVDGADAVDRVARGDIDLVLMDMQMPRMDGLAATRRIRSGAVGADVPIVALTANAFAEDRASCLAAGMNDFISKPLDMADLVAVLWRWLP